jgi:hypothetical protein
MSWFDRPRGLGAVVVTVAIGCGATQQSSIDGGAGSGGNGAGGGGGASACQQATALDRSCTVDSDCVAVVHMTSCCGGLAWIGIRTSEHGQFTTLEAACQASYPGCGCFDGRDSADDGSRIAADGSAAATCQGGTCKTYAPACGHICAPSTACQTCTDLASGAMTSSCAPQCTTDASCTDPSAPRCNRGFSTGLCAPAASPCDMPS